MTLAHPKPVKAPKAPPKPLRRSRLKRVPVALKRGKGIRQRSNSELAKLRRTASDLCSKITLARCPICVNCSGPATDAMHVLGKKAWPAVRFLLLNLLSGCRECHEDLGSARLVGPSIMRELFLYVHNSVRWQELLTLASKPGPDVRDVLPALRKTADELGIK